MLTLKPQDDFINVCVLASCALVVLEFIIKFKFHQDQFWWEGSCLFLLSFVVCVCSELLEWKEHPIVKTDIFRGCLTILHACDGVSALIIGVGLWRRDLYVLFFGILMMTKLFLIHLMNRMILAHKKPVSRNCLEAFSQTSKSFLHHTASFVFVCCPSEIILTTVWRSISMSGHAALALRGKVSPSVLEFANSVLSLLRISFLVLLLSLFAIDSSIRQEFANSAIGHVAYLMVRFAPVFKQGGSYLKGPDKELWMEMTDHQRIQALCRLEHFWLGLELILMVAVMVILLFLRMSLVYVHSGPFVVDFIRSVRA